MEEPCLSPVDIDGPRGTHRDEALLASTHVRPARPDGKGTERKLRPQRSGRDEDAGEPPGLKRGDEGSVSGGILESSRLWTKLFPRRTVLHAHSTPPRDGPLREALRETEEPPYRQGNELVAKLGWGRTEHEEDSSSVSGLTIIENTIIGGIVSTGPLLPHPSQTKLSGDSPVRLMGS